MSSHATLTNFQVDALCYMEGQFWKNKEIPSVAAISKHIQVPEKEIAKWIDDDEIFQKAMEVWGLKFERDGQLTPQQILAVNAALNLSDNRSIRQKLKDINVTINQYNNWFRDPTFQNYVKERTEALFDNGDNEAYAALLKQVHAGEMRAIQLYFEMTGIYNPKVQVEVNVEVVLSKVVDILVRHVKDPEILDAIGEEIKLLSNETRPVANLPVGRAS